MAGRSINMADVISSESHEKFFDSECSEDTSTHVVYPEDLEWGGPADEPLLFKDFSNTELNKLSEEAEAEMLFQEEMDAMLKEERASSEAGETEITRETPSSENTDDVMEPQLDQDPTLKPCREEEKLEEERAPQKDEQISGENSHTSVQSFDTIGQGSDINRAPSKLSFHAAVRSFTAAPSGSMISAVTPQGELPVIQPKKEDDSIAGSRGSSATGSRDSPRPPSRSASVVTVFSLEEQAMDTKKEKPRTNESAKACNDDTKKKSLFGRFAGELRRFGRYMRKKSKKLSCFNV